MVILPCKFGFDDWWLHAARQLWSWAMPQRSVSGLSLPARGFFNMHWNRNAWHTVFNVPRVRKLAKNSCIMQVRSEKWDSSRGESCFQFYHCTSLTEDISEYRKLIDDWRRTNSVASNIDFSIFMFWLLFHNSKLQLLGVLQYSSWENA